MTSKKIAPSVLFAHSIRRIVIDPGHGGKDPGAVGPHGTEEKAINLILAEELADVLRQDHDYEVLLTRMDDTFIPLEERPGWPIHHNADLFHLHSLQRLSYRRTSKDLACISYRKKRPIRMPTPWRDLKNAPLALAGKKAPSPSQVKKAVLRVPRKERLYQ